MNVLLVNPYIIDFTAYDLWLRPLGLLYIAGVIQKYSNASLYWIDALDRFQENAFPEGDPEGTQKNLDKKNGTGKYFRTPIERPSIFRNIPRTYSRYGIPLESFNEKLDKLPQIDVILVTSLMTYWIDGVRFTIETLRERFPNAKFILGGILPTLVSHNDLKNMLNVDYFVSGYGELKVLDILENLGEKVLPHPQLIEFNPDSLPYPAYEFLSNQNYLPLLTSRGCPYHCTYCASDLLNPRFIERSAQSVYQEIEYMHSHFRTSHFIVFDDAFLVNKQKRFLRVFEQVRERFDVSFYTPNGLHAAEIDQETAQFLYNCRFKMLRLSFESTASDILSRSSHKVNVKQMIQAIENLEKAGYKRSEIDVYLLFGLPGQSVAQIEAALDFIKDLGVNPHLSLFSPVPGTKEFNLLQETGVLSDPVNLYQTNKIYFVYSKSGLNGQEIKQLKDRSSLLLSPNH